MARKVLFVDRDGTLIHEPADRQVDSLEKIALVADVIPALLELKRNGYDFVMVSNQDGLGSDSFPEERHRACQDHVISLFASQGVNFEEVFICPHRPDDGCGCRKPRTGLLTKFLARNDLDLERSAVVGDRPTDLELAARLGLRGFLLDELGGRAASWLGIVEALCSSARAARVERCSRETAIAVSVNLDAEGHTQTATGIGFFDHMLEQVAKHGGFRLALECRGDLHVDEHHTVEDVAICLGTAIRQALGDKRGIGRYGFLLPMDESEAQVSIDLSGRAMLVFEGEFPRDRVGGLAIEMVRHFFHSFADALGAAIHIRVRGENTHHMVEACFKSVGRALRPALRVEGEVLPTTKGILS